MLEWVVRGGLIALSDNATLRSCGFMSKNRGKSRRSSVFDGALTSLSARIAPFVREELAATLIAELERHFNERLLPEISEAAVATVVRELPGRIEAILTRELPEQVEAILKRELPRQIDAVIDHALPSKQPYEQLTNPQFYSPNNIVAGTATGEYMTASNTLARDFLHAEFYEFCPKLKHPVVMHRKLWEWAFVYDRLRKADVLRPEKRGIGFGVGAEKLPSVFASLGARIVATDAPLAGHWQASGEYAADKDQLFHPELISREQFDERVSFEFCDMNEIKSHLKDYDFCWSSCAFEHLGSIEHGINFVLNSVEGCLKVGGIACHTTELNLSSDDNTLETGVTVLYRKKDLERLSQTLKERGHSVEPIRIEAGAMPPDYLVDVPPYHSATHLKILLGSYVTTSVGIVVRRGR